MGIIKSLNTMKNLNIKNMLKVKSIHYFLQFITSNLSLNILILLIFFDCSIIKNKHIQYQQWLAIRMISQTGTGIGFSTSK